MTEIKGRIVWAMIGMYALQSALEELLLRWADSKLGHDEVVKVFTDHLESLADRPSWIPWFMLLFGIGMIVMPLFSRLEIKKFYSLVE